MPTPGIFVVETQFLFGLVPGDRWNPEVEDVLDLVEESALDVRCLGSGILEVIFVAKAHGRKDRAIRASLGAMLSKLHIHNIREVETISLADFIGCLSLRERYRLSFYDALHASSTLNRSAILISNDAAYDKISKLRKLSFSELRRQIIR